MLVVYVPNHRFGHTDTIRVCNANGAFGEREYAIPAYANLDSDGDGLLDTWETDGYRVPITNELIMLKDMGCNPHHKDILVQVDWMRGARPDRSIWTQIETIFARAPVLNPDGSAGINLHIDHGQDRGTSHPFRLGGKSLPDPATLDFCDYPNLPGHVTFAELKKNNFSPTRENLFHYCMFGNGRPDGSTGRAEIWGDDFMVTFAGTDPEDWANPNAQLGTFVHELGHNLGLFHGGWDPGLEDYHERFKWNQRSSMNYRYQISGVPVDREKSSLGVTATYSEGIDTTIIERVLDFGAMKSALKLTDVSGQRPATTLLARHGSCVNCSRLGPAHGGTP